MIKELVRSDKEANVMKKTFAEKVEEMQKEVEKKRKDLENTQKTLAQYEVKSHKEQHEKQKLEQEYKKKLQTLEEQLHELKKKQKVGDFKSCFVYCDWSGRYKIVLGLFFYRTTRKFRFFMTSARRNYLNWNSI